MNRAKHMAPSVHQRRFWGGGGGWDTVLVELGEEVTAGSAHQEAPQHVELLGNCLRRCSG